MGNGTAVLRTRRPRQPSGERVRTEHEEQREVVSWFRQTYRPCRIFAIPNGEQRAKSTGARLKAEGVSAGVPDLLVPEHWLWIEMKRSKGGVVSAVQKEWHDHLKEIGHTVLVCHGAADAKEKIGAFMRDR